MIYLPNDKAIQDEVKALEARAPDLWTHTRSYPRPVPMISCHFQCGYCHLEHDALFSWSGKVLHVFSLFHWRAILNCADLFMGHIGLPEFKFLIQQPESTYRTQHRAQAESSQPLIRRDRENAHRMQLPPSIWPELRHRKRTQNSCGPIFAADSCCFTRQRELSSRPRYTCSTHFASRPKKYRDCLTYGLIMEFTRWTELIQDLWQLYKSLVN